MRPYWSVLKDSFREAIASRVLVILLGLSTLALLLIVAPMSIESEPVPNFSASDIIDPAGLVNDWVTQGEAPRAGPAKQLWNRLTPDEQKRLRDQAQAGAMPDAVVQPLVATLQRLATRDDLYDAAAWKNADLAPTARKLAGRGVATLSADELRRTNRMLLESAFPLRLTESHADDLYLNYFGWDMGKFFRLERHELEMYVQNLLTTVMSLFVGIVGVLAAVLVTSPFVPQMFDTGAVDLLFSKPVTRWLLFLTRFLGAGAFIGLNAAYFIAGLWLITGVRFGIWSGRLLLCIPLFLFMFLVYYAVSAAAGVVWRNAVVAVILTVLFWMACTAIGFTYNLFELFAIGPTRFAKIVPAGDSVLAVTSSGNLFEWNAAQHQWDERLAQRGKPGPQGPPGAAAFQRPPIGPVYDPRGDRLLNISSRGSQLTVAPRAEAWMPQPVTAAPEGVAGMFVNRAGKLLVIGRRGVFRWNEQGEEAFEHLGPDERVSFSWPAAALDPSNDDVVIYARGVLHRLKADAQGRYALAGQIDLDTSLRGVVGCGRERVLLALEDGDVRIYDPKSWKLISQSRPEGKTPPRFAYASPDGQHLAIAFHSRNAWWFNATSGKLEVLPVSGQGDLSALAFTPSGELLAADRGQRVRRYAADGTRWQTTLSPRLSAMERIHFYAVRPLYKVFPKPGQLDELMTYLLQDRTSIEMRGGPGDDSSDADGGSRRDSAGDLSAAQVKIDVWGPLISCSIFVGVLLLATCVYVSWRDF